MNYTQGWLANKAFTFNWLSRSQNIKDVELSRRAAEWRARGRPASCDVSVDAAGSVAFWILPSAAHDPADTVNGGWESLALGDAIYVRGERANGMPTMRARMVVSGGFRSFAGSVESMEPLTELLVLRDFRSGRDRPAHFDSLPIYVAGKNEVPGAHDRRLYLATIGDLNEGDSVLILAEVYKISVRFVVNHSR